MYPRVVSAVAHTRAPTVLYGAILRYDRSDIPTRWGVSVRTTGMNRLANTAGPPCRRISASARRSNRVGTRRKSLSLRGRR